MVPAPPFIVAVGASAGGLNALRALFAAAVPDGRIAFVVVTHLPAHRVSHLPELLDRAGALPASAAKAGDRIEGGRVYVLPPGERMGLRDGAFFFEPAASPPVHPQRPIDFFMASMADDVAEHSAGIVLSGTDHDGTAGLKAIRQAGGFTLVQAPDTAEFAGMPQSAISAGCADVVLAPPAMAAALLDYVDHLAHAPGAEAQPDQDTQDLDPAALADVLDIVLERTGHDFHGYRPGMLRRRLHRRMALRPCEHLADYVAMLRDSPDEAAALSREFLIGVTDFFRDAEAWAEMRDTVLPPLLAARPAKGPAFRIWTPGCSSGEESYSIAMLVLELLGPTGPQPALQVFGTDIDLDALAVARRGVYPAAIAATVSAARLARFFERRGDQFAVRKLLRDAVLFAPQNLVCDTPYSRLDLVVCRNVLMYFEPALQERVLQLFHFALKPGGLLWLGKAETLGPHSALFEPVSRSAHLFRRVGARAHLPPGFAGARGVPGWPARAPLLSAPISQQQRAPLTVLETHGGPPDEPAPGAADPRACDLEDSRRELAQALEDAQQSNDALRIASEEASSLNEELQSSNEELESSKEELQSLNEELATVNAELEDKAAELTRSADDLANLLDSTQIAAVLLDRELRIRRFTPAAQRLFSLRHGDEGRLLSDIASRLDDPRFAADVQQLLQGQAVADVELRAADGAVLLRRLQPFRSGTSTHNGVVATFIDITVLRDAARQARELMTVLDGSNDAVIGLDPQGRILSWNTGAHRIYGHTPAQALATDLFALQPAEAHAATRDLLQRALRDGAAGPEEAERWTADGRVLRVSVSVAGLRDDRGHVYALLSTERDITERLNAESEMHFRRLADDIPALLRVEDELGVAQFVNRSCCEFTGRAPEALVGHGWLEFVHPQDRDRYLAEHAQAQAAQCRLEIDLRLRRHDGVYRWMRSVNMPHLGPGGRFIGYVALMLDVEDRKRDEAELLTADRRKDEFLAMLAHELRNPLAPIRNAAQLISRTGAKDPRAQWAASVIERQSGSMAKLLDGLLDVARIARGKTLLSLAPVELRVVIERAVEVSQTLIDTRGQHLTVTLPPDDLFIMGDLERLTQVFANLLNNAAKYTDEGGHITVDAHTEGDAVVVVRVCDTGSGMTPETLATVFDLFMQADRTLDRAKGGLGLGLTLARQLLELHHGSVEAESPGLGQGSTFTVKLPLLPRVPPHDDHAAGSATATPAPPTGQDTRRVLVVDDNVDAAATLAAVLELYGHQVLIAHDGPAAIAQAQKMRPDTVVLDIGLPGMNGYEVARTLRGQSSTARATLIALTGYGRPEDAEMARSAGFDLHFVKPVDPEVLVEAVTRRPRAQQGAAERAGS